MKIEVKNTVAVVANNAFYSITKGAVYFTIMFLAASIVIPLVLQQELSEVSWLVLLLSFAVVTLFAVRLVIDSLLHVKDTSVELTEKTVNCEISGFNSTSVSIPLNQISSMHVQQAFLDKLFGVSSIVISQIAGAISVYGFDYEEAKNFSNAFSEKQIDFLKNTPRKSK